ncbi:MAG: sensor histidine kinase [Pseudobdellovibrio sp.]
MFLIQVFIYELSYQNQNSFEKMFRSIIQKEYVVGNPYKLSQEIDLLESTGVISCSQLKEKNSDFIFLDNSYKGQCKHNLFLVNGFRMKMESTSSTGQIWIFHADYIYPTSQVVLFWLIRFLVFIFIFFIYRYYKLKINFIKKNEYEKFIYTKKIADIAQQVAHDIRSPLSALSMVTATLKDIPEEKRIIIRNATQRINDIANDLLSKGKHTVLNDISKENPQTLMTESVQKLTVQFLPVLVDLLVSEKRMQYMMRSDLEISTELSEGFGAFALVDDRELKRVMSNLINNSVEAFTNLSEQKNKIIVEVKKLNSKQVVILIKDNGQGISEEVLSKLGHEQLSHGKENSKYSGSGLGLYHAKKTIESLQGEFKIESTLNQGTTVSLILPLSETPSWFATEIDLTGKKMLISLDDDISIHQIWSGRLQSLGLTDKIQHIRFQSYELFTDYINQNIDKLSQMQMLIDYELLNQLKTGLDVIEDLVLEKYAILVTSRYEEDRIQERAKKINLKILPKALSGFVPFVSQTQTQHYDWVLLDDDDLVHMTWKFKAKELNKSFIGFKNLEDLNKHKDHLDKTSPVYVDSNLSDGVKGEDVALRLLTEGFINLYIATGYEADKFSHLTFLKGVLGKDPPV